MKRILFALCMMLLLAGCVTSTVKPIREYKEFSKMTPAGNMVVADIEGTNYTSYLFGVFPLVGGSWGRPNSSQYNMYQDTVSNRKIHYMMNWYATKVMKSDGIENLQIVRDTIGWPTLWIVSWRTVHASAQVVKHRPKAAK